MKFSKAISAPRKLLLLGLVTAVGVAGCGGDSEDEEPIAKAQYVKQADSICAKTETRQQALLNKLVKNPPKGKEAQLELIQRAGIPPLATQVDELDELPEPKTDTKNAEAFLTEFRSTVEAVEGKPELLLDANAFAKAETLAQKFGFKVCGGA
jgi:hypothetical protein